MPIAPPSSVSIRTTGFKRRASRLAPAFARRRPARRRDVDVQEGARTLVDHVLVSGNVRTSDELIRRELALQTGRPLGDEALAESQRRLAALGLFRRVRIAELPAWLRRQSRRADRSRGGAGDDHRVRRRSRGRPAPAAGRRRRQAEERIEVAPRGFFEISRRNLWGKNRSCRCSRASASGRATRRSIRPIRPTRAATASTNIASSARSASRGRSMHAGDLQFTAFLEQAIRSSFNFSRRGVRAEYARRLERRSRSAAATRSTTRLFDEKIQPEDQLLIDRLFPQVRLSTFTGSLLRDSRDDVLDPERGTVSASTARWRRARSDRKSVSSSPSCRASAYRRLPGRAQLTLVAGVRLGLAVGFERLVERLRCRRASRCSDPDGQPIVDVVADVPASERFFAGGDTTVRGFVLDRLGTEETLNDAEVSDRRQRPGGGQCRAADAATGRAGRRRLLRRRQRVQTRRRHELRRAAAGRAASACAIDRRSARCASISASTSTVSSSAERRPRTRRGVSHFAGAGVLRG